MTEQTKCYAKGAAGFLILLLFVVSVLHTVAMVIGVPFWIVVASFAAAVVGVYCVKWSIVSMIDAQELHELEQFKKRRMICAMPLDDVKPEQ